MRRHPPAAVDLVLVNPPRSLGARIGLHLAERPGEVDGCRARIGENAVCLVQVLPALSRERVPVSGRDPDRRRTADRHRPDRLGDLGGGAALELELVVGQPALVEEHDCAVL